MEAIRPNADPITSQAAALTNITSKGNRQEAAISSAETGAEAPGPGKGVGWAWEDGALI
jgi:hypothetical protein